MARTFKSAIIWCVPDNVGALDQETRKALVWEDIRDKQAEHLFDDTQRRQLAESLKRAERDLRECVWADSPP